MTGASDIEAGLLARAVPIGDVEGPLFVLGSPRTGSTILYQMLVAGFELQYIANLTNDHFGTTPIVGLSIQEAWSAYDAISSDSRFGKTDGLLQPSEGSAVMQHWFGGGHPSEIVSCDVLAGQAAHAQATLGAAYALGERPLVVKNAWNCFRIPTLARLFPNACFLWIQRDLADAALSDLAARYATKGSPEAWNSATPRNVEELRKRPYWEQVVENQREFARAITSGFASLGSGHSYLAITYAALCLNPRGTLEQIGAGLACLHRRSVKRIAEVKLGGPPGVELTYEDRERVRGHAGRVSCLAGATWCERSQRI